MDKKVFSYRFKETLRKQDISAAELSRITGISEGVISQYKNGKYEPKRDRLELFAHILKVKTGWLGGYDDNEDNKEAFSLQKKQDINETAYRLRFLRENNNLSLKDVADALSISENLVKRREMGDSIDSIRMNEIYAMAELFYTSGQYLMNWIDDPSLNADKLVINHSVNGLPDQTLVAVVGKVSVGINKFVYDDFVGYISENMPNAHDCFFFKQNDQSMKNEILEGDYALIQKSDYIEDGKIGLVCVNESDAVIRKFIHRDDAIILQPFNVAEYNPTVIPWETTDCINIVGKVLYTLSRKKWDARC